MPLIEAMSQGYVPIAGNHSSIPEVMADAGISVNVSNPEEISRAMIRCIQNNMDIVDIRKKDNLEQIFLIGKIQSKRHTNFIIDCASKRISKEE